MLGIGCKTESFLISRYKKFFSNWQANCLSKAPLHLVDHLYGANVWKIEKPQGAELSNYLRIHLDPSRVIHQYISEESSGKIKEIIIARHDLHRYDKQQNNNLIKNNLITFILFIHILVDEYVIKCFKKSKHLNSIKIIHDHDFNGITAIGLTISQNSFIAKQQLIELIEISNKLNSNIPNDIQDNIFKFSDFSILDQVFIDMYPLNEKIFYESPRVILLDKTVNDTIKEKLYDKFSKPKYLPKIFKYILKTKLNSEEYIELQNLIENNPSIVTIRDPDGIIAHQLAGQTAPDHIFYLFYKGLCKYNSLTENKDRSAFDFEQHYKFYFDKKSYSYAVEYRTVVKMEEIRNLYVSKLHHYSMHISDYEYKKDYLNLQDQLDVSLLEEQKIMKSLHLGVLQGNQLDLNKTLTQVINSNDIIKFKSILFHLRTLPLKDNGSFLEYILRNHKNISMEILEVFFVYYYNAYGKLLPDGPYNQDLDTNLLQMIKNYNIQVKEKEIKQLKFPKLQNFYVYENCTIKQYFSSEDGQYDILLIQKPICLLTIEEKEEMYIWFAHNFDILQENNGSNKSKYFHEELSVKFTDRVLELVTLFYDNKTRKLISFLTSSIKEGYHQSIGEFILIHAKLAGNNPNYSGLNLVNIALGQILLVESRLNNNKPTYVFFKSIPPGYAICMMPFHIDFFPKNYMPYYLLQHIIHMVKDTLTERGMKCKLKVNSKRTPKHLSFPLRFYKATIGDGVKNAMPVIFSVDNNTTKAYFELLKHNGINSNNLSNDLLPLHIKMKNEARSIGF